LIRVGHVVLVKSRGQIYDGLVLSIEGCYFGILDFSTGVFNFVSPVNIVRHFELGITEAETQDVRDDITLEPSKVKTLPTALGDVGRGTLVSFTMYEQGAALEVKAYFLDKIDYPEGYALVSEMGASVSRFWRVPRSCLSPC